MAKYKVEDKVRMIEPLGNAEQFGTVTKPAHYADGEIETIDFIRDKLTQEEYIGYCTGNVLKYISRWRKKGGTDDLKKARVYLGWAIEAGQEG